MTRATRIWHLGAQLMASVQAREHRAAQDQLDQLLGAIIVDTRSNFTYLRLRTVQVLTNVNRAAFAAGAATDPLARHSQRMLEQLVRARTKSQLLAIARAAVTRSISFVPNENAFHDRIAREAVEYLEDHYMAPAGRDELAARLGCSPAHFSRVFSDATGRSYRDYILDLRVAKAKELLRLTRQHIAEIARQVGYEDPFQFSRVFSRRVGVSPRQFRKSPLVSGRDGHAMKEHERPFF